MKSVAVVDDDASARKALVRLIGTGGYDAIPFGSAAELLSSAQLTSLDCVVSDLRMPDTDGIGLQRAIVAILPHLAMVIITGQGDIPSAVTAMKAGAIDLLEKPVKAEALLDAIARAIQRTEEQKKAAAVSGELHARYATLTEREKEVFALVTAGLLNKQVAAQLDIAEKTVKQHRARVIAKMDADSLADLAVMAEALGARPRVHDFLQARGLALQSDARRKE